MSQEKREIKVFDKRMFTPEGELRDEYRHFDEGSGEAAAAHAEEPTEAPPARHPEPPPESAEAGWPEPPPLELPGTPPELGGATFVDLVAQLAEPAALYLGDAALPDGRTIENLEMARFQIDLLDVLRQKTAGRLTAQEAAVLEDILYRLRMRYVQKRG